MKNLLPRHLFVLLALLALPTPAAQGSAALAMDVDQMTKLADRVVVGEVMSVKSAWDSAHKRIFTNIEVQVAEAWKGASAPGGRILVQQPGGRVGDVESRVHGLTAFRQGDRAVLFLKGSDEASAVLGLGQGVRSLQFDPTARTWMVGGGDRSAAVTYDRQGHFVTPKAVPLLPLQTLRAQVLRLVKP